MMDSETVSQTVDQLVDSTDSTNTQATDVKQHHIGNPLHEVSHQSAHSQTKIDSDPILPRIGRLCALATDRSTLFSDKSSGVVGSSQAGVMIPPAHLESVLTS